MEDQGSSFPVEWEHPEDAQAMWLFDVVHCPVPLRRLDYELRMSTLVTGNNRASETLGFPLHAIPRLIHGFIFQKMVVDPVPPETIPGRMAEADAAVRRVYADLGGHWQKIWLPEIHAHLAALSSIDTETASLPALLVHLADLKSRIIRLWELHTTILMPALVAISDFDEAYRALFPDAGALDVYDLLAGFPNKSTEANVRLWEIGRAAASSPYVRAAVLESAPGDLRGALSATPEGRALWTHIEEYNLIYGERNDDLFLDTPTWIDDPTPVLRGLREAVLVPERDLGAELGQQAERRDRRLAEVRAQLESQPAVVREELFALLAPAQVATVLTEDHHFWIDCKVTHHGRRLALATGRRLAEKGLLDSVDDVFDLSLAEITALGAGPRGTGGDHRAAIAQRKADIARFKGVTPPPFLGTPSPMMNIDSAIMKTSAKFTGNLYAPPAQTGDLVGMAGSRGKVKGPARIVRSLEEASRLSAGDILVAPYTLPSWTPFFASVAGVVTNVGGILCHAAVVAREYGVPAVVGTARATSALHDGQIIEVDGDAGVVRVHPA
jgi:phosphohistidine swiveling domain-containing protein